MNNFSPNMLKTYQTCPKKYFLKYIEKINVPQSATPFEQGKRIHALANYNLHGIKIDRLETVLSEHEKKIWSKLLNNPYYQKDCLKSEFTLFCKVGNFFIGGRIDAVIHDFNDYCILDYKTGNIPQNPAGDFQTMVYLLCMDRYLKNYNKLQFVYISLKDDRNEIIEFNDELKSEYIEKITDICKKITEDKIYICKDKNCKSCEYSKICN